MKTMAATVVFRVFVGDDFFSYPIKRGLFVINHEIRIPSLNHQDDSWISVTGCEPEHDGWDDDFP